MSRAVRLLAWALFLLGAAAGVVCFVMLAEAETPGSRAVDVAAFLVDVAMLTALSFFLWPRRAH